MIRSSCGLSKRLTRWGGQLNLAPSASPAGKDRAEAGVWRTGAQPNVERPSWSEWRLCAPRKHPMTCSACDTLGGFLIGLGRPAQRGLLKRFDILQPIAHLVAQLEEQRAARFGSPALQSLLTQPPALGQLGLGHASFGFHVRPSAGFVRTAMKALFAKKAKWGVDPFRNRN